MRGPHTSARRRLLRPLPTVDHLDLDIQNVQVEIQEFWFLQSQICTDLDISNVQAWTFVHFPWTFGQNVQVDLDILNWTWTFGGEELMSTVGAGAGANGIVCEHRVSGGALGMFSCFPHPPSPRNASK